MQIWSQCEICQGYDCEHQQRPAKPVVAEDDKTVRKPRTRKSTVDVQAAPVGLRPSEVLVEQQQGRCKLCMDPMDNVDKYKLSFDYDPRTHKPRGVLCIACKGGIQNFRNNVALLARAIRYIETVGETTDG